MRRFDGGLDGEKLWEPYLLARNEVELYPQDPQEPPSTLSYIEWDEEVRGLTLGLEIRLPSKCPRFADRACPKMIPMGHENAHETCNYWNWSKMEEVAPGIELYPEWQRFDCHKYFPIFQNHLVGEALARHLRATPRWQIHTPQADDAKMIAVYAGFSSRPDAFVWLPIPA